MYFEQKVLMRRIKVKKAGRRQGTVPLRVPLGLTAWMINLGKRTKNAVRRAKILLCAPQLSTEISSKLFVLLFYFIMCGQIQAGEKKIILKRAQ